jgi:peptidoglycan-associated lipoprotein
MSRMQCTLLGAIALAGLLGGCGKKTMETPPPVTPPPTLAPAPTPTPPPPPPPAPPVSESVEMQDVYFDYDSSDLRSDARATLSENGRKLVSSTKTSITVEGHCDERGTVDYNLALGDRRANAAKDFLVSYGVDGGRIKTISYGENKPFALGHDEASFAQNRRAHFVTEK